MRIAIESTEFEATPENAAIFTGDTMLSGVYVDLDDDYVFLPHNEEYIPNYAELALTLRHEGVPVYDLKTYDPESVPFCFIINALCRMFRNEIDNTYGGNNSE